MILSTKYSKTCLKRALKKKIKNWFSRPIIAKCRSKVLQNAPKEHSAILLTLIQLPFVFKTFALSIFEWPLKTGFYCINVFGLAVPQKQLLMFSLLSLIQQCDSRAQAILASSTIMVEEC